MTIHDSPADTPAALVRLWPSSAPTPLLDLPCLAARCGVAQVLVKDEGPRLLGSFKTLGGMYAGLRALARAAGLPDIAALVAARRSSLPPLLCASAGNHGLAVAAAARLAGAPARVYLHEGVPRERAQWIAEQGAEIVWISGTYDDAVAEAKRAAAGGDGLLISDISERVDDPVVADVMAGYGLMAQEIADQLQEQDSERPTHLFVQAGVGGLAAAMAEGLRDHLAEPRRIVVVEPDQAPCVAAALAAGRVERVNGDLDTSAEMLACGEASAPALRLLLRHGATALLVSEAALRGAPAVMAEEGGPTTTESGAAGLAGLLTAPPGSAHAGRLNLDAHSRILLFATEAAADDRIR
ncbi:MAG TPA: pyridoxal-phosphate dependent enzyme [Thermoanaerobaculia bacterium]|nr:pyridoxal-phosphate dependent enzyme [Thermoanaerobaculia bacterium]